jgi:hypothetical protein
MKKEVIEKVRAALHSGRCRHEDKHETTDKEGNLAYLKCITCGLNLVCGNCQYGQYNGYKNVFYCINHEESKMDSNTCRDWTWHKSLAFTKVET